MSRMSRWHRLSSAGREMKKGGYSCTFCAKDKCSIQYMPSYISNNICAWNHFPSFFDCLFAFLCFMISSSEHLSYFCLQFVLISLFSYFMTEPHCGLLTVCTVSYVPSCSVPLKFKSLVKGYNPGWMQDCSKDLTLIRNKSFHWGTHVIQINQIIWDFWSRVSVSKQGSSLFSRFQCSKK